MTSVLPVNPDARPSRAAPKVPAPAAWGLARSAVVVALMAVLAPAPAPAQSARLGGGAGAGRPARVVHLPGIGGERAVDHGWVAGLIDGGAVARDGGPDGGPDGGEPEAEVFDWTDGRPGLPALAAYDHNRARAVQLAGRLADLRRAEPGRPIVLTAHSGGAGIAVWALEALPPGVSVDRLVLVAPALSPGYDLSPALAHVSGRAYALTSARDAVVLGTGTRLFGTIDRVNADAAGRVGFDVPGPAADAARGDLPSTRPTTRPAARFADPAQYAKLVALPYDPAWAEIGNRGGHRGAMGRAFARRVVAPLLLAPAATPSD